MNIPITLEPFIRYTHCTERLGEAVSDLVNEPKTRDVISTDFPKVPELYGTPEKATQTIQKRQQAMLRNTGYGALFIMMGSGKEKRLTGIATYSQMTLRRRSLGRAVVEGPLFAAWKSREPFSYIGEQLLEVMIRHLVKGSNLSGRPFTVVRPDNDRSVDLLTRDSYRFGGMQEVDEPSIWNVGDELPYSRQLFVTKKTLEELRMDPKYKRSAI